MAPPPALPVDSTPLWRLSSAPRSEGHRPLTGDTEADVVVIGAGITGLATAVEVLRGGRSVVVLEAREVGSGTSGHTTAKASALQGLRYRTLTDRHGGDVARRFARSQLDALDWMAERLDRGSSVWDRRPAVTYATTPEGRHRLDRELEAATAAGLSVEDFTPGDLPFETTGSIALAGQIQFDPQALLNDLAAEVSEHPAGAVHEWSRVTAVRGSRDRPATVTETGTVHARYVVVATLLPIVDRGLFFARCEPSTSHLVALRVADRGVHGMHLGVEDENCSLRSASDPRSDGEILLVGGAGHPTGTGGSTLDRQQRLVEWASARFDVEEILARWSAHDLVPADHLPWVGSTAPWSPNVLTATGFEKWGMTMGVAAAMTLGDRISGVDGVSGRWSGIFAPDRGTLRSLPDTARINGQVALKMASGWLFPDAPPDSGGDGRRRRTGLEVVGEPVAQGRHEVVLTCTHMGGVCAWNDAERTWDCPLHGSRFDENGNVVAGPAIRPLRRRTSDDGGAGPTPLPVHHNDDPGEG